MRGLQRHRGIFGAVSGKSVDVESELLMEIIVTDTHTRMALAVVRELGAFGYDVTSVTREGFPSLGHASRYAKRCVTLSNETYADDLLMLSKPGKNVLLPTGMYSLTQIAERHEAFSSAFFGLFSPKEVLHGAEDKPTVAKIAKELGLRVPETYAPDAPRFPCVLKYRNGEKLRLRPEQRYAIVQNQAQYEKAFSAMKARGSAAGIDSSACEIFVSEYIPGEAYGVSAVLDQNAEPLSLFCHLRMREYPISGGPACLAQAVWHPKLIEAAVTLLKALGLRGFAMVEFKGTPERPYILEVNPRIWGTYPLSRLCGAGMANAYVQGALGNTPGLITEQPPPWTGLRMQYLVNDMANLVSCLRNRTRPSGNPLWDMLSPRTKGGVFDRKDLPGSFAYFRSLFRKMT